MFKYYISHIQNIHNEHYIPNHGSIGDLLRLIERLREKRTNKFVLEQLSENKFSETIFQILENKLDFQSITITAINLLVTFYLYF